MRHWAMLARCWRSKRNHAVSKVENKEHGCVTLFFVLFVPSICSQHERTSVSASATQRQREHQPLPPSLRQLRVAHEPQLVPVPPASSIVVIGALVQDASTRSVSLLVPNRTKALRSVAAMACLRAAADHAGVHVVVYAADRITLDAARQAGVAVVVVQGRIEPPQRPLVRRLARAARMLLAQARTWRRTALVPIMALVSAALRWRTWHSGTTDEHAA
jgi:hypothetical protein